MRRRDFILLVGGAAAAWPLGVRAQQKLLPVIGIINDGAPEAYGRRLPALFGALGEKGFVEGRSVAIEYRWARGNYDALPDLAADLVRRQVDVIVTFGSEAVTRAVQAATKTIPIVAAMAGDPVKRGFVASINEPGGNITVISVFTFSGNALVAKRLELLHELLPRATTVGWLADSNILDFEDELHEFENAAKALRLNAVFAPVPRSDELETALLSLVRQGAGALLEAGPNISTHREQIIALAARERMPVIYEWPEFVRDGGLMSYGTDLVDIWRQAGVYAARILMGEKPAHLPVVQPTKFPLVINLKTAKALGIDVSPSLLARADEVIE